MFRIIRGYCLLAGTVLSAAPACANWAVRPVASGGTAAPVNVDVMVAPDGQVVVGYALPQAADGGRVWVSRLSADGVFEHRAGPSPSVAATFAMDRFGGVYYVSSPPQAGLAVVGGDLGEWGGLVDGHLPLAGHPQALPSIAVNPHSIPAIAWVNAQGEPYLARFDAATGTWLSESGMDKGGTSSTAPLALAYDGTGRQYYATIGTPAAAGELVIASRAEAGVWRALSAGSASVAGGVGLAGGSDGAGFACITSEGLTFGMSDGWMLSTELIGSAGPISLSSRSVAFNPSGNPAIVYVAASPGLAGAVHLLRRGPTGNWVDEQLPITALRASVAFDAAGNPLVAAATDDGVALLGTMLAPIQSGDLVGSTFAVPDGIIDRLDLDALIGRIGSPDPASDLDGDGLVTPVDADHLITAILGLRLGDANLDGRIDGDDYFRIDSGFAGGLTGYANGDFNHDGILSGADYRRIDLALLETSPWLAISASVPEPSSSGLFLVMSMGLLVRRLPDRQRIARLRLQRVAAGCTLDPCRLPLNPCSCQST